MAEAAQDRKELLEAQFQERLKRYTSMDIVAVAQGLGLELQQKGNYYVWKEHDSFQISPSYNTFRWWSRDTGGSVIDLVRTVQKELTGQDVSFKQATDYLRTGNFETVEVQPIPKAEPFSYYLAKAESQDLSRTRAYLKDERGLSDETIDFFIQSGNLAQANFINYQADNLSEPVIVFKAKDLDGKLVGASLQGIENHPDIHERGHLKQIMKRSDGLSGFSIDVGQPKRLVFAEAPIDLMSYYEVHKEELKDVRLVAMDGLKKGTISHYTLDLLTNGKASHSLNREQLRTNLDELVNLTTTFKDGKNVNLITLAVDNDEAGRKFIDKLKTDGIPVVSDIPPIKAGQEKMDWNDFLKQEKSEPSLDNSRLAQARRKLERLEGEQSQAIQKVFDHYKQTNGQPMNDKRGGDAFFRKADRLDERVVAKNQEIEQQRERVERLEERARNKELGLNRQGTGLEMSVRNIPRIREEIEKSKKGESVYTKATIKRYEKELERLEAIASRNDQVTLSPTAQALVEAGELNQWQKQPITYFVKGLRKVALEMDESGNLVPSQKYRPKTDKERERVEELLQQLKRPEKGADMSEPEEKQGVLFENLNDITTRDKTEEKTFIDSLNKENLVTSLELMQKYSVAEVGLNRPYYMGDDHRFEEATIELSHINTSSLNDFVQRYIVPKNEWEDVLEAYENLSYETLSNELVDQGVLNADQLPQEKPWQPKIITEPITSYEVVEDNNHKEQFSSAEELIDYVKKIISSDQLQKLEHILSEPGRGDVLDSLMIIDSDTADIDYGISLNGESLLELFPDRINKEVTEVTKTVTRTEEELLENNQVLSQAAPKNLEKTSSPPDLQVVFRSSDENLLSDNYSS
ncbi:toprim domain-containing protein, partial [Streptococcus sobrinus]|uniref:toprim domain-containing protein n=1 Tax=Streptococcus sobrinus TaxID=1310 RepID=UPI0005B62228